MGLLLPEGTTVKVTGVAADVAEAIAAAYTRTEGVNLADEVLHDARDPKSPLHKHFTWNDTEAAEKYRRQQAEALIRRVKVQIIPAKESEPITVRAYIADRSVSESPTPRRYVGVEDLSDHGAAMVASAQRDLAWLRRKYRHLSAFSELLRAAADDIESGDHDAA